MKSLESSATISQISEQVKQELREYAQGFEVGPWPIGEAAPESVVRRLDMLALYPRADQKEEFERGGIIRGEFENKAGEIQPFDVYVVKETKNGLLRNIYFVETLPGQDETSLAGDVSVSFSTDEVTRKRSAQIVWTHTMKSNTGSGVGTHALIAAGEYMLKQYKLSLEAGDIGERPGITTVWDHLVQAKLAQRNPYRYLGLHSDVKNTGRRQK